MRLFKFIIKFSWNFKGIIHGSFIRIPFVWWRLKSLLYRMLISLAFSMLSLYKWSWLRLLISRNSLFKLPFEFKQHLAIVAESLHSSIFISDSVISLLFGMDNRCTTHSFLISPIFFMISLFEIQMIGIFFNLFSNNIFNSVILIVLSDINNESKLSMMITFFWKLFMSIWMNEEDVDL